MRSLHPEERREAARLEGWAEPTRRLSLDERRSLQRRRFRRRRRQQRRLETMHMAGLAAARAMIMRIVTAVRRSGRGRLKRRIGVRKGVAMFVHAVVAMRMDDAGVFLSVPMRRMYRRVAAALMSGAGVRGVMPVMRSVRPGHRGVMAVMGRSAFMFMRMRLMDLRLLFMMRMAAAMGDGVRGVMRMLRSAMSGMAGDVAGAVAMGGRAGGVVAVNVMAAAVMSVVVRRIRTDETARERIIAIRAGAVCAVSAVMVCARLAMIMRVPFGEPVRVVLKTGFAEGQKVRHAVRCRKGRETVRNRILGRPRFGGGAHAQDRGGETEDERTALRQTPAIGSARGVDIEARAAVFQRPDGASQKRFGVAFRNNTGRHRPP